MKTKMKTHTISTIIYIKTETKNKLIADLKLLQQFNANVDPAPD
jgi:hypothetical protein